MNIEPLEDRKLLAVLTIAQENLLAGTPASQWDIDGSGDDNIDATAGSTGDRIYGDGYESLDDFLAGRPVTTHFGRDAIFAGGVGRTDLPNGGFEMLARSIRTQIYTLPDETVVFPGHGERTTVGAEKETNPYMAAIVR